MAQQTQKIIVVGAGYAGMIATMRLAGRVKPEIRRGDVAVTLINADDRFVERVRLHELAANAPIAQRSIADMLGGTGVQFTRGAVTGIDLERRTIRVQTDAGIEQVEYDRLVYALGSTADWESVPGLREHAYALTPRGPRSAMALREALPKLDASKPGGVVLVCGGGATGIEAAAEFADAYPNLRVELVTRGDFGRFLNEEVADYMRQSLSRRGVTVRDQTSIAEVNAGEARTALGEVIPFDLCLWTGGFAVPPLARQVGLAVNEVGQIWVDPFLRSTSHPEVYAIGDAAQPREEPGVPVRMAAFTAIVMGAHSADCLSAALRGRESRPLSFAYGGQGIALGRHDAIAFNIYPDDHPHRPYVTGRIAASVRKLFVGFLGHLPALERRFPGFFFWPGQGRYAAKPKALRSLVGSTSIEAMARPLAKE